MRPVPPIAVAFVRRVEGMEREAYPDPLSELGRACAARGLEVAQYRQIDNWSAMSGAPWTIGAGHTGSDVHPGDVWTDEQIDAALTSDLGVAVTRLEHVVLPEVIDALPDNRYAALLSFSYNVGAAMDWQIWQDLNHGRMDDVPVQMARFIYAAHRPSVGLQHRRDAEIALWNGTAPECAAVH